MKKHVDEKENARKAKEMNKDKELEELVSELWEKYHYMKASVVKVGFIQLFNDFEKALTKAKQQGAREEREKIKIDNEG